MANITEYLRQVQALTRKNLEMLRAINESFNTKKSYLSVSVDDINYKIPSYLALESRITDLQEAFYNLVNAPKTGEAHFNFNGNTQEIQVKTWSTTPESIKPVLVKDFNIKDNNWFKDLLNPVPYIKFDLSSIADDINKVNVRKVVLKSEKAQTTVGEVFADEQNPSTEVEYQKVIDAISVLEKGLDYEIYDKIYDMPIRDNSRVGKWTIKSIDKNYTDENFDEFYVLTLNEELKTLDDNGIEKYLQLGDYVLCNGDKVKLQIVSEPKVEAKQITVKVLYGGYTNLVTAASGEAALSTITYFSENDFYNYKYIDIPLEEDKYIFVFADTVNELNVKSLLKTGLLIDTEKLVLKDSDNVMFNDYYHNIINIGDKLESITTMFTNGLNVYTQDEYNIIKEFKPNRDYLISAVKQINEHLDNSSTVKNIRGLYAQKQSNKTKMISVQNEITRINELINQIDFNDTTGIREVYSQQLIDKQSELQNLQNTIKSLTTEIADEANNSVTPIENAKYRIRGFFDVDKVKEDINKALVSKQQEITPIKINVLYRYRNNEGTSGNAQKINSDQSEIAKSGSATSIGEDLLFSDWNVMYSDYNKKVAKTEDFQEGEKFGSIYEFEKTNNTENAPSFNQIDIPITQGEKVDIKISVQFDLGYPFVCVESDFSEVITVDFPEELQKNVEILDIVDENNDEVKKFAFDNILTKYGVQEHVGNSVQDNNTTFYHSADKITSGFYTPEQRVISLKEKLNEMNNKLTEVSDEVFGTNTNDLTVVLSNNIHSVVLNDNDENIFNVQDFISNTNYGNKKPLCEYESSISVKLIGDTTPQQIKIAVDQSLFTELNNYKGNYFTFNNGDPLVADIAGKLYEVVVRDAKLSNVEDFSGNTLLSFNGYDGNKLKNTTAINETTKGTFTVFDTVSAYKFDRINLQLQNNSKNMMKIYPLFFGERQDKLTPNIEQYMSAKYFTKSNGGVGIYTKDEDMVLQRLNQVLYFRLFDPYKTSPDGNESKWFYTNVTSDTSEVVSSNCNVGINNYTSQLDNSIKLDLKADTYAIYSWISESKKEYVSFNGADNKIKPPYKYNTVVCQGNCADYYPKLEIIKWYGGKTADEITDVTSEMEQLKTTTEFKFYIDTEEVDFKGVYLTNNYSANNFDLTAYPLKFTPTKLNPVVNLTDCTLVGHLNTGIQLRMHSDATILSEGEVNPLYDTVYDKDNKLSYNITEQYSFANGDVKAGEKFAFLYPYVNSMSDIQLKVGNSRYYPLKPGESISLGLMLEYFLTANNSQIEKTIAFDVRTSLYSEPHLYIVKVKAQYESQKQFEDTATNRYNAIVTN